MPLHNYGVLKGRVLCRVIDQDPYSPHYHLLVEAGTRFHVAINIWSNLDYSPLLCLIDSMFEHPVTDRLALLDPGFTLLPGLPGSGALDYQRGGLLDRSRMKIAVREDRVGGGLAERFDQHVNRAIEDDSARIYAFGTRWGPNPAETDRTFPDAPIHPSDGVHDVHMNQGNPDRPGRRDDRRFHENGPWQDGAVLFHFPDQKRWIAIFLAFQSQSWETDPYSGRPLAGKVTPEVSDESVRIVEAMINPIGPAPEAETVTLSNLSDAEIDLTGWRLANVDQQITSLSGVIESGQRRVIAVSPDAPLGNDGGVIHLFDSSGRKIDGVAYTRRHVAREGRMIEF